MPVPIISTKKAKINCVHPHETEIKYVQHDENTCFFSSLSSALFDAREYFAEHTIVLRLKLYLLCESKGCKDRIKFLNDIMVDKERNKGGRDCCYKV